MKSPVPDYLDEIIETFKDDRQGELADYIPELARADPDTFGIALTVADGRTHSAGNDDYTFSIQSISKPFAYAAALTDLGLDAVHQTVGVEPSGEAFNELSLEHGTRRPKNAMINAGAIAVHQLLVGPSSNVEERVERVRSFFSELAGRELSVDEAVCRSELDTADRNLAIAHMLKNYGIIDDAPHDVVEGYTRQCSIGVSVRDLAMMCATLANMGVHPVTGQQVVSRRVARQTLSVMTVCGMYDAAGEWLTTVGIPAKSGVSGGLIGALPGQCGLAVVSPPLDEHGNSVRGVRAFRKLTDDMGMHLAEAEPQGATAVRDFYVRGDNEAVLELQGTVQFSGAEAVLHALENDTTGTDRLTFDLSRVDRVNDVARRMLLEAKRRAELDGRTTDLVDPDGVLTSSDVDAAKEAASESH